MPVFDLLYKWYIFKGGPFISLQNWLPWSPLLHVSEFCVNIYFKCIKDNKTNKYINSSLTMSVSFSVVHTCGRFVLQSRDVFLVMCTGILFSKLMVCWVNCCKWFLFKYPKFRAFSRHHNWFSREVTSEKRLPKHCPELGSATSSVWNFCSRSPF